MRYRPFVSVIIPSWNRAAFLPEAIGSVRAQNYENLEIIVVDDGSTDDTPEVLASLGRDVRTAWQQNAGPAAARNHGISLARGELIAFLDSDDVWATGGLEARVEAFERNPAAQMALGLTQVAVIAPHSKGADRFAPVADPAFVTSFGAALCRREVFEVAGLLDASLRTGEDVDWFLRCREAGVMTTLVPTVTTHVRRHEGSMTFLDEHRHRGLLVAIKRSLDRRRFPGSTAVAPMRAWEA